MARRTNVVETVTGTVVILLAAGFLVYAVAHSGRTVRSGYTLHASFDSIDGLGIGSAVKMAGVKVGSVIGTGIDPKTYQATVGFTVEDAVKLPKDSSAAVVSEGLLGGKYLKLQPGGDEQNIPPGGQIGITQSSINIEELLGKFVFSMGNLSAAKPAEPGGGAAPANPGANP